MDLINLSNNSGSTHRPGIGGYIYVAEIPWITVWGTMAPVVAKGDKFRRTGDHTFYTGKGWRRWEMEDEQAKLALPIIGARSSKGLKPRLETFIQSLTPAQVEMFTENKDLTMLINAFGCGADVLAQIGDVCNPVRIIAGDGWGSGTTGGNDPRGWKLIAEANYSLTFYEGDVELYPA